MNNLTLLKTMCSVLQENLNARRTSKESPLHEVRVFNGPKPYNYYLPVASLKSPSDKPQMQPYNAWFVEVFVNNVCVFRQSSLYTEDTALDLCELQLAWRIINDAFGTGVMSSKVTLENFHNQ